MTWGITFIVNSNNIQRAIMERISIESRISMSVVPIPEYAVQRTRANGEDVAILLLPVFKELGEALWRPLQDAGRNGQQPPHNYIEVYAGSRSSADEFLSGFPKPGRNH